MNWIDQLADIRARYEAFLEVMPGVGLFLQAGGPTDATARFLERSSADIGWLLSQVDQFQARFRELEWAAEEGARCYCPVCQRTEVLGHATGCWLAAVLDDRGPAWSGTAAPPREVP
jgi:hypothetical protein